MQINLSPTRGEEEAATYHLLLKYSIPLHLLQIDANNYD
jgi:hypothetical protein